MTNKYDLVRLLIMILGIAGVYATIGQEPVHAANESAITDYTKGR